MQAHVRHHKTRCLVRGYTISIKCKMKIENAPDILYMTNGHVQWPIVTRRKRGGGWGISFIIILFSFQRLSHRSHTTTTLNAGFAAGYLTDELKYGTTKEYILERNLICARSVGEVLLRSVT